MASHRSGNCPSYTQAFVHYLITVRVRSEFMDRDVTLLNTAVHVNGGTQQSLQD